MREPPTKSVCNPEFKLQGGLGSEAHEGKSVQSGLRSKAPRSGNKRSKTLISWSDSPPTPRQH